MSTPPFVVALIATCNRPALLARRALPSIAGQTRRPDMVVIVDDSSPQNCSRNKKVAAQFAEESGIRTLYRQNHRSKGASGAWNTGALSVLRERRDAHRTYIAILDDDDEWLPGHLAQAEELAQNGADLIATPFLRQEPRATLLMNPPALLNGSDFLVGNPGVVGSSLVFRLSAFCRAGMFDESLPACTDRDLCLRFSMLGNVSYHPAKEKSAIHYADDNRQRLSTPLSNSRLAGLTAFFHKYRPLMTDAESAAFQARAEKLFGWQPPAPSAPAPTPAPSNADFSARQPDAVDEAEKISLVIGIIAPPNETDNPLFSDITKLSVDKRLSSVNVVVMPSSDLHVNALQKEADKWRQMGIRVHCISGKHAATYTRHFGITEDSDRQRPISVNRTILQHVAWRISKNLRNPVCWILDGDLRLHGLAMGKKSPEKMSPDYIGEILRLRNSKCDVAIGSVNGAAPLPRFATVRPQMVDLLFCLAALAPKKGKASPPPAMVPDVGNACDYYHDYGTHTLQERLAGMPPLRGKLIYRNVIAALPRLIERILAGDAVTRPLLHKAQEAREGGTKDGIAPHRGGNTLVFNTHALRACPNGFARGAYAGMRRSDEVWRLVGEAAFGWKVTRGDFPVTQSRGDSPPQAPDGDRMAADIVGHAVSAGLRKFAGKKRFANVQSLVDYILQDDAALFSNIEEAAQRRLSMVCASFYRIRGIIDSMLNLLAPTCDLEDEAHITAMDALRKMKARFSQRRFAEMENKVAALLCRATLTAVLSEFPQFCRDFHDIKRVDAIQADWYEWLAQERRFNATTSIQKSGAMQKPFRFIGHGREGTVFTDGRQICKILHDWYSRADVADPDFLLSLSGKWSPDSDVFYPIIRYRRNGGDLWIFMPYEKTLPYKGGYGASIAAILAAFRKRGIALWNPKLENMRVIGSKVRFIDYGNDLRPFTERDFDIFARKIWLCWRWAWRNDLGTLLSAAVNNAELPELAGYENLKAAVEQYAVKSHLSKKSIGEVLSAKPRRVFDFGCGKNEQSFELAQRGVEVCGYDPNMKASQRRKYIANGVKILEYADIAAAGTFDVVILRNVVCEIISDRELRQCLSNVRRLTGARGKVIVTACDVDGITENTCATNVLSRSFDANRKAVYKKRLRKNGVVRAHVHRPSDVLLREFARAGLKVKTQKSFSDIDLSRFATCGGTLHWVLTPMPHRPATSLVIRACAMDSDSAEAQVRHLVRQLSLPRDFAEVILAIDSHAGDFLRQHRAGNLAELLDTANRLKRQGVIDRIVVSPAKSEKEKIKKLNRKWMGLDCAATHTPEGAPLAATFAAFDQCRTPYALHIDIDMIIGRVDDKHDYLGEMLNIMEKRGAFTLSLDVAGADGAVHERLNTPFRIEVRAGLTNLKTLKAMLPLAFDTKDNIPLNGWHRAVDNLIRDHHLRSLRGGRQHLFMIHPPNKFKKHRDAVDIITNAVEAGKTPEAQRGKIEWDGAWEEWLPSPRQEPFIFVICGRNVDGGKIARCLESISRQKHRHWGAIIMDDASMPARVKPLKEWVDRHSARVTYFRRQQRVGGLSNLVFAVRHLCGNPQSVIVTLDMDDALFGDNVLSRLADEYQKGADLTVGSMLRFDKQADYPVCFDNPYARRGGNVWQHLRSFRKSLFDSIPDAAMRDDNGGYFALAEDWAYMLPMVKMAQRPIWVKDILYLYEPNPHDKKKDKANREATIGRIIKRGHLIGKKRRSS